MTITALLIAIGVACGLLLWWMGRPDPPSDDDDHVSRQWLDMFVRDRRDG